MSYSIKKLNQQSIIKSITNQLINQSINAELINKSNVTAGHLCVELEGRVEVVSGDGDEGDVGRSAIAARVTHTLRVLPQRQQ